MLTRKVMWTSVLSLLTLFLAVGFPTSSQTTGRSQEGAAKRQLPDTGAVTARPFSGSLPASGKLQLNVERRNHTATALPDGRVLIIGGDNQEGAIIEAEMLDSKSSTLVVAAKLLTARTKHAATLLPNGKVLVTGGLNLTAPLDSTELYDPKTGEFSAGPHLQRARASHSATLLGNGEVLIAGGQGEDSAELYDPIKNRSVLITSKLTAARKGHSAVLLKDGNVLLVGGEAGKGHNLESAEIFNPATQSFSATAFPMMLGRARATLRQLLDGKVQVIGGDSDGSMEIYDPATGRFGALVHLAPTAELFSETAMLGSQSRAGFIEALNYRDARMKRSATKGLKTALGAFKQQEAGRSKYAVAEIPGANQALIAGGVGDDGEFLRSALLLPSSPASVSTNQVQYLPGEAPIISGTGWQAGEAITIIRQDANLGHKRRTLRAFADLQGNFVCTDLTANDHRAWTAYTLTASGGTSGQVAQTAYFDAPPPGREKETLGVLKFHIPLTSRDFSFETETVTLKWKSDSSAREGDEFAAAATMDSCAFPDGNLFNFSSTLPDLVNQPCLGTPGNLCQSFGDVRFTSACLAARGDITAEICLLCGDGMGGIAPPYAKFSIQADFKGQAALTIRLDDSFSFPLFNFPTPLGAGVAAVPGLDAIFSATVGLTVRARILATVVTPTEFNATMDFGQSTDTGFDSRNNPVFFNNVSNSGAGGDVTLTKLGEASAKIQFGPNVGVLVTTGPATIMDFGVGILGFIEPATTNVQDTATCKTADIDLHAGVEGDATARLIGVFNESAQLPIFRQQVPGYPKPYVALDTAGPAISQGTVFTTANNLNSCGSTVSYTPSITDTCSGVNMSTISINPPSGSFFPIGTTPVTVSATDNNGNPTSTSFNVTVSCPTITLPSLPGGTASVFYDQSVAASPAGSYTYSLVNGSLPPGLTLNTATGQISGTPTQMGIFNFRLRAAICSCSVDKDYSLTIACPTITLSSTTLPNLQLASSYGAAQTITATPAGGNYSFAVTGGHLPPGMTLNSDGSWSGSPTRTGNYSFTVSATGFGGCTGGRPYSITTTCPTITTNILANGTASVPYNQSLTASPAGGNYSFAFESGTLPPGLIFNNGTLSGTPTIAGTYNFTIRVTGFSGDCFNLIPFTVQIACPTITLSALTGGTASAFYSQTITASPAGGNYSFAVTGGMLPPGLGLNSAGLLSGTPTLAGTFTFTVTATGFGTCTGSRTYSVEILCPTITLSALPGGTVAVPYFQYIAASPAGGSYTFALTGSLPPGLTFNNGGIFGTPTQPGTFTFTVTATGFGSCTGTQTYAMVIACPTITLSPLPGGTAGGAYNQTLTASPAGGNYSFALTGGALPPGLSFNNGVITGTPTLAGTFNFTVTATGFGSCAGSQTYFLAVACPAIGLTPATLPGATVNTAYSQALTATPSGTGYTFTLTGGLLPPGLALATDGTLSGAPTQAGTFNFRVTAAGWGACSGFRDYQIIVTCPAIIVGPASLPGGTVGAGYDQTVSTTPAGGYSFSVASGALPPGLTLNATSGRLSGTPTQSGSFNFRVLAAADTCSGIRDYTLTIACTPMVIAPAALPAGTAGLAYSQTVSVTPGGSYTFSLAQGNLPSGLTLNSQTGVISGLPSVAGAASFIVKAQQADGCGTTQQYTLTINCPTVSLSPASLPNGATGTAYSQTLSASPAGGSYSFAVTTGALPMGLSLNPATGALTGTPTANGTSNFTITATGFGSCAGAKAYSIAIGDGSCPTITLPDLPSGAPGQLYNTALNATPSGTYSYAVTSGSLPPGLTLYASFGLIYGFPATSDTYSFTITATDSNNCAGSKSYNLRIGGAAVRSLVFGDFDGDGKADLSVWRGQSGDWLTVNSGNGKLKTEGWGLTAAPYFDVMAPGDYDGDGKMDLAVFRKSTGQWLIKGSKDGAVSSKVWGVGTDVPVPGDYDGDGKTDLAVWRGAESNWYILRSSDQQTQTVSWGTSNAPYRDLPVAADFDGDGKTDIAVFRQMNGHWYIRLSSDDSVMDKLWGLGSDVPVAADYDGDGKADIAVWRGSQTNWYILQSSNDAVQTVSWGTSSLGDVPVPGDYDGDGKADVAVWREKDGTWYVQCSRDHSVMTKAHGTFGDTPLANRPR